MGSVLDGAIVIALSAYPLEKVAHCCVCVAGNALALYPDGLKLACSAGAVVSAAWHLISPLTAGHNPGP